MMTPGTSLFDDRTLLSSFDGERTVVDPGSRPSWSPEPVVSAQRPMTMSHGSGHSWSRTPEPVWGASDAVRARFKDFMGLLERDLTYAAVLGAALFLAITLVCFFATATWRYGVVQNARAAVTMHE
jgi:hypothetical protein